MSVTSPTSLFQFTIASLGQAFTPDVSIQNATDFVVIDTNATTGNDTVLTLNTDYFVTGTFVAGVCVAPVVTLENAGLHYAVGDKLTIQRAPGLTQPTTYVDGQKYLAATTNNALDWLIYCVQGLRDQAARALSIPLSSGTVAPFPLSARKNMLVGFDANGNPTLISAASLIPSFSFSGTITALTGGGVADLDGLDCSSTPVGAVQLFIQAGVGLRGYQLQTGTLPVGPLVVTPLNSPGNQWVSVL